MDPRHQDWHRHEVYSWRVYTGTCSPDSSKEEPRSHPRNRRDAVFWIVLVPWKPGKPGLLSQYLRNGWRSILTIGFDWYVLIFKPWICMLFHANSALHDCDTDIDVLDYTLLHKLPVHMLGICSYSIAFCKHIQYTWMVAITYWYMHLIWYVWVVVFGVISLILHTSCFCQNSSYIIHQVEYTTAWEWHHQLIIMYLGSSSHDLITLLNHSS